MAKAKRNSTYWMYGRHGVRAACENAQRTVRRVLYAGKQAPEWARNHRCERADNRELERFVGTDAVHQGILAEVEALPQPHLEELLPEQKPLWLLDQVTDPHNIGAMLRTAAAFNIGAIVLPKDGAPGESGVLAKTACGALETVPLITVTNLASAMQAMKQAGYWLAGMDGSAKDHIHKLTEYKPLGLVMGAEGPGLRRLTAQNCDLLVKIPICSAMESLNVSNAAAIGGYVMGHTPQ